ncbi:hypothetical protein ACFWP2_30195 [Kitasatospora sp. NPDC058444]|uniref:hypothetical protein n=1 Tax=Kitasatospora sp. NPDC058444 TaxID=3346504 RepID=UPI003667DBAD
MLDHKLPWPLGGFNVAPIVSTLQTNGSAGDLVAAFGKQNVEIELQTLKTFAGKVEALLAAMEGSAAAPYKLEEQKVTQGSFVNGADAGKFPEAVALNSAYGKVHDQLVKLHKDFVAQIEAMTTAVAKTASSYDSNENQAAAAQNAVASSYGANQNGTPPVGSSGTAPKSKDLNL